MRKTSKRELRIFVYTWVDGAIQLILQCVTVKDRPVYRPTIIVTEDLAVPNAPREMEQELQNAFGEGIFGKKRKTHEKIAVKAQKPSAHEHRGKVEVSFEVFKRIIASPTFATYFVTSAEELGEVWPRMSKQDREYAKCEVFGIRQAFKPSAAA